MSDLEGVLGYYGSGIELGRLTRAEGLIEAARTKELILRYVPKGSTVLDVGGGVGFYADWLAHEGHVVRLIDPVPEHVEEARGAAGPEERAE